MNYQYANHLRSMKLDDYFSAWTEIGDVSYTLPLDFDTIKNILFTDLSIWYVYLIIIMVGFLLLNNNPNYFKDIEHGSSRWASKYEISLIVKEAEQSETAIPLAKDVHISTESRYLANLNEIVLGGSGSGKTFRKIKPDILQLTGSYVITDPKGELYHDCAKFLMAQGYKVRVLNFKNVHYSNSFNPFVYITNEQDVLDIADLFMKNTADENDKGDFWSNAALKLLTALMLYVFKAEHEIKTFGRVVKLLNSMRYKNGAIDQSCELARCLNDHSSKYPYDAASITWSGMQGNAQETMSSITEVLSTRMRLWQTSDLDAITSTDEMDFDSIGREKTAIFVIMPPARNMYKAVCNIFFTQLFERLQRVAEAKYDGKLPLLVSCEIDEFANIGEIPNFVETLSVVRSYNIRICIVLQSITQLKALYEKTYEAIIGNCDIMTVLGCKATTANPIAAPEL